jgi:hypothetical protein
MKLNHNLEVEWLQQNFYGLDTIGDLHTFNINDDGSITTTVRCQKYDVVSLNLSYNHLLKFELDKNGTILSRELLGNGIVSDTTVVYKSGRSSVTPSYEYGEPQKIDDIYYLKSNYNYNDSSFASPNHYAYITRLTTEPFAIKRDFIYLNGDRADWSAFSLLSNGNYLFFTHDGHGPFWQRAGIYSSDFQILFDTTTTNAYTSCIYDSANYVPARQLINDTINVVTLSEMFDDGHRYFKIHKFDNEDGAYIGLDRKVRYQLEYVNPTIHFDDKGRLYGTVNQTKVFYDTISTDSIVKKSRVTYYFLYEKTLGILDTFAINMFESPPMGGYPQSVQIKSDEFVVAGSVVQYPEVRLGGYIHLAKIKTPEPVGVIDAEIEKKNMMYDVWVYNTYPNPAHSSTSIKFFCTPKHLEDLKVVIYDEMGRAYPTTDYEISNYDSNQGVGTMRVPLDGISTGPRYIMLQVNNDSFTTCIMVE